MFKLLASFLIVGVAVISLALGAMAAFTDDDTDVATVSAGEVSVTLAIDDFTDGVGTQCPDADNMVPGDSCDADLSLTNGSSVDIDLVWTNSSDASDPLCDDYTLSPDPSTFPTTLAPASNFDTTLTVALVDDAGSGSNNDCQGVDFNVDITVDASS